MVSFYQITLFIKNSSKNLTILFNSICLTSENHSTQLFPHEDNHQYVKSNSSNTIEYHRYNFHSFSNLITLYSNPISTKVQISFYLKIDALDKSSYSRGLLPFFRNPSFLFQQKVHFRFLSSSSILFQFFLKSFRNDLNFSFPKLPKSIHKSQRNFPSFHPFRSFCPMESNGNKTKNIEFSPRRRSEFENKRKQKSQNPKIQTPSTSSPLFKPFQQDLKIHTNQKKNKQKWLHN